MVDDRGIRKELRGCTGWSPQNLTNRVTGLLKTRAMPRTHALYVLAHRHGVSLEKYGVADATLIEVGDLTAKLTEVTLPPVPTNPERAKNGNSDQQAKKTLAAMFNEREFHSDVVRASRRAFSVKLYEQAVESAAKSVYSRVDKLTRASRETKNIQGTNLMEWAFRKDNPPLQMTDLSTTSSQDEHTGLGLFMQGLMLGIRNPLAHEYHQEPYLDPGQALELLSFASYLHRCLDRCEERALARA